MIQVNLFSKYSDSMAFPWLSAWFEGPAYFAEDKRTNLLFLFPFFQVLNKKFQEMTNEDAVEFLKGKIYPENPFPPSEETVQDSN